MQDPSALKVFPATGFSRSLEQQVDQAILCGICSAVITYRSQAL